MQTQTIINKLIRLLEQVSELYQSILTSIQQEQAAIIESDLAKLIAAGKAKENDLLKIRILEEQRIGLISKLSMFVGCEPSELTLERLAQIADETSSQRLQNCHSVLRNLVQGIQDANRQNKALFEHSLELIRGSYHLLNNLLACSATYQSTGNIRSGRNIGKVLCGEI